jgi:hypothetical protein
MQIKEHMSRRVEIIGDELTEDDFSRSNENIKNEELFGTFRRDTLSASELKQLRTILTNVVRPRWHDAPPRDLGSPAHGKLKAAQLRSLSEFDLLVGMVELWADPSDQVDQAIFEDRMSRLQCTMHLFTALKFATSESTSPLHAQNYQLYLQHYLQFLIQGGWQYRPNHHAALHVSELLMHFGPIRGWWMFPFERIIGRLQRVNTNSILGESRHILITKQKILTICRSTRRDAGS